MKIFKETFEKSRRMREAEEKQDKQIDLRDYTVKEFAEMIDEDDSVIQQLMRDSRSCSYVDKPYEAVTQLVQRAKIPEDKQEIVCKFLYTNLYNNPKHRFYNGRGWGPTLRKTI